MNNFNTNIKRRVIPLILVSNYQVVKSREFKDHRTFGNLEQTITVFNHRNVDEIIVVDIDASKNGSKINLELFGCFGFLTSWRRYSSAFNLFSFTY